MEISLTDIIAAIGAIGIASMVGGFIYVGRKLQTLDDLRVTTHKIKTNVKVISDFLTRDNKNFNPAELKAYSPLQLTPEGEDFIRTTGFDKVFEANQEDFFNCMDAEHPKLKYDVEIAAMKSISLLYDKEYMNFLKVFFYNNPARNLENTAPTLGVYLRDKYLARHPEITE